ncbi:hypothetical protein OGATHE_001214 [Ogataea polymorpha]|uniref:Uncharacterized protein n=1 Tax=Ogataea polymorpha TaxID=460523 RepID=A0A9P8PSX6_9ASCO|nr:hypothetical protein OGATHE_001214 [Ogataea polymorpha]
MSAIVAASVLEPLKVLKPGWFDRFVVLMQSTFHPRRFNGNWIALLPTVPWTTWEEKDRTFIEDKEKKYMHSRLYKFICSNDGGTNTRSVLGLFDLDRVVLHVDTIPAEHVAQALCCPLWEVWVLEEDGSVSGNVALFVVHLFAHGRDTANRESGCSGSDKLRQLSHVQSLLESGVDEEFVGELIRHDAQ